MKWKLFLKMGIIIMKFVFQTFQKNYAKLIVKIVDLLFLLFNKGKMNEKIYMIQMYMKPKMIS